MLLSLVWPCVVAKSYYVIKTRHYFHQVYLYVLSNTYTYCVFGLSTVPQQYFMLVIAMLQSQQVWYFSLRSEIWPMARQTDPRFTWIEKLWIFKGVERLQDMQKHIPPKTLYSLVMYYLQVLSAMIWPDSRGESIKACCFNKVRQHSAGTVCQCCSSGK